MTELNEFSTECVKFARDFFLRETKSDPYNWILDNIYEVFPLPYLRALTQRPECSFAFYTYHAPYSEDFIRCICEPVCEDSALETLVSYGLEGIDFFVHRDIVIWSGKILFDRRGL